MTATKQTKAERIFRSTYAASRNHIRAWGYTENSAWTRMETRDDEVLTMRTVNAIQKLIDRENRKIEFFEKQGIADEREVLSRQALEMVQNTLDNERERIELDKRYFDRHEITWEEYMAAAF